MRTLYFTNAHTPEAKILVWDIRRFVHRRVHEHITSASIIRLENTLKKYQIEFGINPSIVGGRSYFVFIRVGKFTG